MPGGTGDPGEVDPPGARAGGVRRPREWEAETAPGAKAKAKARAPRGKGGAIVEEWIPEQWRNIMSLALCLHKCF